MIREATNATFATPDASFSMALSLVASVDTYFASPYFSFAPTESQVARSSQSLVPEARHDGKPPH